MKEIKILQKVKGSQISDQIVISGITVLLAAFTCPAKIGNQQLLVETLILESLYNQYYVKSKTIISAYSFYEENPNKIETISFLEYLSAINDLEEFLQAIEIKETKLLKDQLQNALTKSKPQTPDKKSIITIILTLKESSHIKNALTENIKNYNLDINDVFSKTNKLFYIPITPPSKTKLYDITNAIKLYQYKENKPKKATEDVHQNDFELMKAIMVWRYYSISKNIFQEAVEIYLRSLQTNTTNTPLVNYLLKCKQNDLEQIRWVISASPPAMNNLSALIIASSALIESWVNNTQISAEQIQTINKYQAFENYLANCFETFSPELSRKLHNTSFYTFWEFPTSLIQSN